MQLIKSRQKAAGSKRIELRARSSIGAFSPRPEVREPSSGVHAIHREGRTAYTGIQIQTRRCERLEVISRIL